MATISAYGRDITDLDALAQFCREEFAIFVKEFWDEVPGTEPLIWNWHIGLFCKELQESAKRVFERQPKLYDHVFNVPFGTSKSTVISILFPAWAWANMPEARFINATHTEDLGLDLAEKFRTVVNSDKYQRAFPYIKFESEATSHLKNTSGGDRFVCTVGGKTPTGLHSHWVVCFPYETQITTDRGCLPIGDIVEGRLPVRVLAFDHAKNELVWRSITRYDRSPCFSLCRVFFDDGSSLDATSEHPVYVEGVGYVESKSLRQGDVVYHVVPMRGLPQGSQPDSQGNKEKQEQESVLFPHLSVEGDQWEETPCLERSEFRVESVTNLRVLQKGVCSVESTQTTVSFLQRSLSGQNVFTSKEVVQCGLRFLREDPAGCVEKGQSECVLLFGVQEQTPFQEDARQGKPQLCPRPRYDGVSGGVREDQEKDTKERQEVLFSVWNSQGGVSEGFRRASYRRQYFQQRRDESGDVVSIVPLETAWEVDATFQVRKKTVVSVERNIRLPGSVYNIGVDENRNYFAEGVLVHNCDDPIDPQGARSDAELETASLFMTQTIPSRVVDKEVSVIILVMQRLHYRDPSSVLLKLGQKEGATPVRHVCLPGELTDDVSPPIDEIRGIFPEAYRDDNLLDPKRLSRRVLTRYRETLSLYGYSAQVQQNPVPPGGGMFKSQYFNQRVKAAPYHAKRVRFWDRAATAEGGCFTAGVLMARDNDGVYYVEHVVHGQWDPFERNNIIEATALKDRVRYGPNNEPIIYIESETGSTGKESFQRLAAQLAGYRVREDRPTGSKDNRAEPWSTACAAGIVRIVDNGESKGLGKCDWDVLGFVEEHTLFKPEPGKRLGGLKDRVDASSGSYNLLSGLKTGVGQARAFSLSKRDPKAKGPRVVVCSRDVLRHTVINERTVLCVFQNPPDSPEHPPHPLPTHGLNCLLAHVTVEFPDLNPPELQDRWDDPIPPWEKPPAELLMTREHGKKIWAAILKKRDPFAEVFVLVDDGDRRALSAAYAVCEGLYLQRKTNLFVLGSEEDSPPKDAPNSHVYEMMRVSRSLVVT